MVNTSLKKILFTTNLDKACWPAFELAALMASRFQAKLVLLHVLEQIPDYVSIRLQDQLGEKRWIELTAQHAKKAREALIGKKSSIKLVEEALNQFCINAGIDDTSCGNDSKEIVVGEGDIVEEILENAKKYNADLIVMGSRKGFLSDNRIGHRIKSVMRQCHIPVMVVPNRIK